MDSAASANSSFIYQAAESLSMPLHNYSVLEVWTTCKSGRLKIIIVTKSVRCQTNCMQLADPTRWHSRNARHVTSLSRKTTTKAQSVRSSIKMQAQRQGFGFLVTHSLAWHLVTCWCERMSHFVCLGKLTRPPTIPRCCCFLWMERTEGDSYALRLRMIIPVRRTNKLQ